MREWHPPGHTRCPGYIRGHVGIVTRSDGRFSIPDVEAHSTHRVSEATYSVRFAADELWNDGQPGVTVNVDLWDNYLEPCMSHAEDVDHHHPAPPSPIERRATALEELLSEKGLVPEGFIDEVNPSTRTTSDR